MFSNNIVLFQCAVIVLSNYGEVNENNLKTEICYKLLPKDSENSGRKILLQTGNKILS